MNDIIKFQQMAVHNLFNH